MPADYSFVARTMYDKTFLVGSNVATVSSKMPVKMLTEIDFENCRVDHNKTV
jgi:hypothetical protein